jgi:hypothetical protein
MHPLARVATLSSNSDLQITLLSINNVSHPLGSISGLGKAADKQLSDRYIYVTV